MVEKYFKQAFNAFSKNWLSLVLGMVLIGVITGIFILIAGFTGLVTVGTAITEMTSASSLLTTITGLGIASIIILIGIIFGIILFAGFIKMCAEALKGKTSLSSMFNTAKEKALTSIFASILVGIIFFILIFAIGLIAGPSLTTISLTNPTQLLSLGIGLLIGIILLYLIGILFTFTFHAIVIDNLGAISAIKKSIDVAMKKYLTVLIVIIIFLLIQTVIGLIPFLGQIINAFIISPLALLTITAIYLEKQK